MSETRVTDSPDLDAQRLAAFHSTYKEHIQAQLVVGLNNMLEGASDDVREYAANLAELTMALATFEDGPRRERFLDAIRDTSLLLLERSNLRTRQNADRILRAVLESTSVLIQRLLIGARIS